MIVQWFAPLTFESCSAPWSVRVLGYAPRTLWEGGNFFCSWTSRLGQDRVRCPVLFVLFSWLVLLCLYARLLIFFFFFSYSPKNPYNLINVHLSRLVDEGSGERCIFPLASVDGRSVLVNNTLVFHYAIPDFWRRNLVSYQSKAILFVRNEALWLSLSEQTSREFIHPIHGCVINDSVLMDTGILKP